MKKIFCILPLVILFSLNAFAQPGADTLPYRKYPTLPAFNIVMMDSSSVFNTFYVPEGKPTVLMFFSPDCDHCEQVTDAIVKHMDDFKDAQIYLFTPLQLSELRAFYNKMNLKQYKNIIPGKDNDYFFPRFYGVRYVPFIAIYDRNKKLVTTFEGGAKIEDLIKAVH